MNGKGAIIFTAVIVCAAVLLSSPAVLAQGITVIGEAKMYGKSFLKSADERWMSAPTTYPVVQDTAIRTDEGLAVVYFKDGSRASLSTDSEASIGGSFNQYKIDLARGRILFNIAPGASLSVEAGSASIFVNNKKIVRKASYETLEHIRGAVTFGKNSIEVQSIAGLMSVGINASTVRDLKTGEAIVIGPDNTYRVFMAQAVEETDSDSDRKKKGAAFFFGSSDPAAAAASGWGFARGELLIGFVGGTAYVVKESFSGSPGFCSPCSPGAQRIRLK